MLQIRNTTRQYRTVVQ